MKENFLKNKEEILKFLEAKVAQNNGLEKINTGLYGMNVLINYTKLCTLFKEIQINN
jgi:hypothetical protein